jgi:mRNA-degrading endonuclease RelE of RelBE toxin-antitoxin system
MGKSSNWKWIQGTGGLRKIRVASKGRGKRGGSRVIYYYFDIFKRFYLLTIYAKNEITDLTPEQKRQLKIFMEVWCHEQT